MKIAWVALLLSYQPNLQAKKIKIKINQFNIDVSQLLLTVLGYLLTGKEILFTLLNQSEVLILSLWGFVLR